MALYEAKARGKHCYVVFRPEMQTALRDRLELELDLRDALAKGELRLVYQPTFDLYAMTVTGVEALLRWHHPVRGDVPPATVIPIAEDTGLIVAVGQFVLEEACTQAAAWHAAGYRIAMAVNVSGRQLEREDLVDHVKHALEISGLGPQWLVLEITETVLMRDTETTAVRLHALKALGIRISVDDFGTGYSSLAYLRQFPVDSIKIDRSFITNIAESSESEALIHTLVQLGKSLGIETLAEGIEQSAQLVHLQQEHCDVGQGFLFCVPSRWPPPASSWPTTRSAAIPQRRSPQRRRRVGRRRHGEGLPGARPGGLSRRCLRAGPAAPRLGRAMPECFGHADQGVAWGSVRATTCCRSRGTPKGSGVAVGWRVSHLDGRDDRRPMDRRQAQALASERFGPRCLERALPGEPSSGRATSDERSARRT